MEDSIIAALTRFDGLPIPAGVLDLDGRIVAVNAVGCTLLGRRAEDLVDRKAWTFAPGIEHVWAELVSLAHKSGVHTGEIAISTPLAARTIRYVMSVKEAGRQSFVLAFAVDVTPHLGQTRVV